MKTTRSDAACVAMLVGKKSVRNSVMVQIAQTMYAPTIAPLLLPLPPMVSITQTMNVVSIG